MNFTERVRPHITRIYLMSYFHYNPSTGDFFRIYKRRKKKTGFVDYEGYLRINIMGGNYAQHRLAWFYMTGVPPLGDIDHIDGDKTNNKFENLRDVPRSTNLENKREPLPNNSTGYLGVSKHHGKFRAKITVGGKEIVLGRFSSPKDAHKCYLDAKREFHTGCTI